MNLISKFDMNQQVWGIGFDRVSEDVPCHACAGEGSITLLDGKLRNCPECYGRATKTIWHESEWRVRQSLTIGEIRVKVRNIESDGVFDNVGHYVEGGDIYENEYMCYETGVGSGTIHSEDRLFFSRKDAQGGCDARNAEKAK